MLCDKCHRRQATVHLTQIVAGSSTTVDFCPECAERLAPPEMLFRETCHYCGGPYAGTAPDLSQPTLEPTKPWVLCQRCSEEFFRYAGALFSDIVAGIQNGELSPPQAARYQSQAAELDRHMQAWVSQRDAK